MVDGVARRRSDVYRSHANCFLTSVFSAGPPGGFCRGHIDRRKLILLTESWMASVAIVIAVLTISGLMTPWLLLALTFALSAGDAFETPTWRAVLPELVPKDELASASALNGIEFNLARAVGPALAGSLIAAVGIGAAFVANVLSFMGVIVVIARWKRPVHKRTAPAETLGGATVAAIRYIRYSPPIRALMVRTGAGMFFASAPVCTTANNRAWHQQQSHRLWLLLGFFGTGAVLGALAMQPLRNRWSTEVVVSSGIAIMGIVIVALGTLHRLSTLGPVIVIGGGAWILFISLVSALIQNLAPDWVRARVFAVFILVSQGSMAFGAQTGVGRRKIRYSHCCFVCAGFGMIGTTGLALVAKLPDASADLSPWNHWRVPGSDSRGRTRAGGRTGAGYSRVGGEARTAG